MGVSNFQGPVCHSITIKQLSHGIMKFCLSRKRWLYQNSGGRVHSVIVTSSVGGNLKGKARWHVYIYHLFSILISFLGIFVLWFGEFSILLCQCLCAIVLVIGSGQRGMG